MKTPDIDPGGLDGRAGDQHSASEAAAERLRLPPQPAVYCPPPRHRQAKAYSRAGGGARTPSSTEPTLLSVLTVLALALRARGSERRDGVWWRGRTSAVSAWGLRRNEPDRGRESVTPASHRLAATELAQLADELGHGRLLALGGGGYTRANIAAGWNAVVEALLQA